MSSHRRLSWIVEQLDVQPRDHVLEIGCGHGIAAGLVLERLKSGCFMGLDRSASMIAASELRNQAAVQSGRAEFACSALRDANLGDQRFDRVFAARVAEMTGPDALAVAGRLLAPGAVLLLSFDSPDDKRTRRLLSAATANLHSVGFDLARIAETRVDGHVVVCISATAPIHEELASSGS
jgi:ubiquinone/menaquinone biosynthesis C-methylase UbiE